MKISPTNEEKKEIIAQLMRKYKLKKETYNTQYSYFLLFIEENS